MMPRRRTAFGLTAVFVAGLAGCTVRVSTGPSSAPPVARVADTTGWTTLFADDFGRAEPGEDWAPRVGQWAIEDGALKGMLAKDPTLPLDQTTADIALQGHNLPDTVEIRYETWSPDEVGSEAKLLNAEATRGLILALYGTPHPALASRGAVIFLQGAAGHFQFLAVNEAFTFTPQVRHKVRIVRQPEGVTVFVDAKPITSATVGKRQGSQEPTLHLVGSFGSSGSAVYFDNLDIRAPRVGK